MASRDLRATSGVPDGAPSPSTPERSDAELFPWAPPALKGDLQFLNGALSWYLGGPAGYDVSAAWERVTDHIAEQQATIWLDLKTRRDETSQAANNAQNALLDAKAKGWDSHLPSLEDVQRAIQATGGVERGGDWS